MKPGEEIFRYDDERKPSDEYRVGMMKEISGQLEASRGLSKLAIGILNRKRIRREIDATDQQRERGSGE